MIGISVREANLDDFKSAILNAIADVLGVSNSSVSMLTYSATAQDALATKMKMKMRMNMKSLSSFVPLGTEVNVTIVYSASVYSPDPPATVLSTLNDAMTTGTYTTLLSSASGLSIASITGLFSSPSPTHDLKSDTPTTSTLRGGALGNVKEYPYC